MVGPRPRWRQEKANMFLKAWKPVGDGALYDIVAFLLYHLECGQNFKCWKDGDIGKKRRREEEKVGGRQDSHYL